MARPKEFTVETPEVQIVRVDQTALEAINRAEVDVQIATAKEYPRDVGLSMQEARSLILANENVAGEMFYSLPRDGKAIQGPSTRFAECLAVAWGNCRIQVATTGEDKRFITAQAMAIDLQKNYGVSVSVRRRITTKSGSTYGDDMVGVTSNAAISIAYRNAVLRMIPKPYWFDIYEQVMAMASGEGDGFAARLATMVGWFEDQGVKEPDLLRFVGVARRDDIGGAQLKMLRGIANAIKQGEWRVSSMTDAKPLAVVDEGGEVEVDAEGQHGDALRNVRANLDGLRGAGR